MIFFQHWNIGAYERQVYGSDMVHFMYWKSTRSLEKHCVSFTFAGHQQCLATV